jgi:hypothetical protein
MVTNIERGDPDAVEYVPPEPLLPGFYHALTRDPIAIVRSFVNAVCSFINLFDAAI